MSETRTGWNEPGFLSRQQEASDEVKFLLGRCTVLKIDPDRMRQGQGPRVPRGNLEDGTEIARTYYELLLRGDDLYKVATAEVCRLFPIIKSLRLRHDSFRFEAETVSGETLGMEQMSDGLLRSLVLAVLEQMDPISVLLIEEPERGIHPAKLRPLVQILRRLSQKTQVLFSTYSPLLLDELHEHEVTLVTLDPERGTQTRRMSETAEFRTRSVVHSLGDLWCSYSDGVHESALLLG